MRSGVYNCGFLAVGCHAKRDAFLDWWCKRLEFGAFVDFEAGLFTDQKWIDLAPGLFPDVQVLRHPGYNVAYWNLGHRALGIDERGHYTAGGQELAFFHFSGVDPHDPTLLSKHQTRFDESDLGPFRPAYRSYVGHLLANDYDRYSKIPYAFGKTKSGAPIVPEMRQVFRHCYDVNGPEPAADPFGLGPESFCKPTDQLPRAAPRISLLLYEAWKRRDLLRESFDVYSTEGREGLLAWSTSVGERVLGVSKEFVEESSRELERFRASRRSGAQRGAPGTSMPLLSPMRRTISSIGLRTFDTVRKSPRVRRLYYRIPPRFRTSTHRALLRTIGKFSLWSAPDFGPEPEHGVSAARRLEHSRLLPRRVQHRRERSRVCPGGTQAWTSGGFAELRRRASRTVRRPAIRLPPCAKSEVLRSIFASSTPTRLNCCLTPSALRCVSVTTSATGSGNSRSFRRPGAQQWTSWTRSGWRPHSVSARCSQWPEQSRSGGYPSLSPAPLSASTAEKSSGCATSRLRSSYNFDYYSYVERKNPVAVVRAFKLAFPTDPDVALIVKSTSESKTPEAAAALRRLAGSDPRIVFIDGFIDRESMWGLLSVVDAYVSLHRSEGLGLGLAESMLLGKPAIATGYSGNLEFMNRDNSCLVDYRLVPVPDGAYPFAEGPALGGA